jgi:hypothetical protein
VYRADYRDSIATTTPVRALRSERGVRSKMAQRRIGCFHDIVEEILKVKMVCAGGDCGSFVKRI